MNTKFTLLLFSLFFINVSFAQVQSPKDFLPTDYTENFTPHHEVISYFEYVAANSNSVKLQEYGRTNQDRALVYAIVTAPSNMDRLEEIRKNNLRQTGIEEGSYQSENAPAIVWLSFGVHGNEAGASESSMQALYNLVSTKEGKEWLKNTVVIFDPSINPDGYSRYSHWYRNVANKMINTEYTAREHQEPWPTGRVNHYHFDLNRDWAWATQVETQQRLKVYREWMPHIHADLHEQYPNNPYYFAPAAKPLHKHITPFQYDFQTEIGKNHASYFDKEGWTYFTREVFDLFYPSYGDTYPTFNGAIGMTYEQAGHGISGRAIDLENGDTLMLHDRIDHHTTTALSTVEMAAKNAKKLNTEFVNYFKNSKNNPPSAYKSFVISSENSASKIKALTDLLDHHGIEYGKAGSSKSINAFNYQEGKNVSARINEEDLVISAYQPMGLLTQVLFEPESELEDSLTYDITAWSLPYAHGLKAYALESKFEPNGTYEYPVNSPVMATTKTYAYFASRKSMNDNRFLGELLQKGIGVRYAEASFTIEGKKYEAGTLIILRADNEHTKDFTGRLNAAAKKYNINLMAAKTGFSDAGHDLGSDAMKFIKKPKIAVLSGKQTNPNLFGHTWHFFEQDLNYPVTVMDADKFSTENLVNYNVLVMPDGYYSFDEAKINAIGKWVSNGGKVIALGSANNTFANQAGFALERVNSTEAKTDDDKLQPYAGRERRNIPNFIPGAIIEVEVDDSHPLGFGLTNQYFTLKNSGNAYEFLANGWNVGHIDENPRTIGFVGYKVKNRMKNTLAFGTEPKGSGQMIYLIDNPLFRGFWEQGKFLMSNAVFMVK